MIEIAHEQVGRTVLLRAGRGLQFACRVTAARRAMGIYGTLEFQIEPCNGTGRAWVEADLCQGVESAQQLKEA